MRRMLSSPDLSIRELSQETGISAWSLYDWRKKAIGRDRTVAGKSKHPGKQPRGPWPAWSVVETTARGQGCRQKRIEELERELRRKEKGLAETAALLTLRKKAAATWGEGEDA